MSERRSTRGCGSPRPPVLPHVKKLKGQRKALASKLAQEESRGQLRMWTQGRRGHKDLAEEGISMTKDKLRSAYGWVPAQGQSAARPRGRPEMGKEREHKERKSQNRNSDCS